MKLIDKSWNPYLGKYEHCWLADTEDELTAGFDAGTDVSMAFVIETGDTWVKNSKGQWQKVGTTEVKA